MRKNWVLCVLAGALAWGQATPGGPPPQSSPAPGAGAAQAAEAEKDSSASVPPTAAVITIDGVCDTQSKTTAASQGTAAKGVTPAKPAAAGCKTVITKAQFDALASNLAPNITPQLKKQLASVLPRLMAMADEAKKQGLENTPQYKERVKFNRMQILAQELQQKMQEQAAKVPEADIEKYYKDHPETFEQASVERVFVPRMKQIEPEKLQDEKEAKAGDQQQKEAAEKAKQEEGEKAMTKLADDLRARAAAGEDFLKLQKEAFEAAGMKIESPTVTLPNIRRSGLPPSHAAVFDLKPGEVSQVISDSGGHYFYKVVSKNEVTLEQAKTEIQGKLQSERMKEQMDKLNNSFKVETNEAYFGPGGPNATTPRPMRPRPGMPPAPGASAPQAQPGAAKPQ